MSDPKGLGRLKTDLGERSTYDAVSQCSRCGYCEQACPTYVATGLEAYSPRGRTQLVRLMLEGKLSDPKAAEDALSTCLLCGACQTICYAHVSVPDIVLEGRRMIAGPAVAAQVISWLLNHPRLLRFLLKAAYALKRMGFSLLARPFLRLAGLSGLAAADAQVSEAPSEFLCDVLARRPKSKKPAWHYFAACGSNYVFPRVGLATWEALSRCLGEGAFLNNGCCGLVAYNYGDVGQAKALAQRVILSAEQAAEPEAPIIADCSSCAAFLKSYPQLFLDDPVWRQKAEQFVRRMKDVIEVLENKASDFKPASGLGAGVVYHESCRACNGQGLSAPKNFLKARSGQKLKELEESTVCCGGAGAYEFMHPELSEDVLKRKIEKIAQSGARVVATSSTSCLIQLARGLRKYYPAGSVVHVSELAVLPDAEK